MMIQPLDAEGAQFKKEQEAEALGAGGPNLE